MLLGALLLASSIPLFLRVSSLKQKNRENKNKSIEVKEDEIIINNEDQITKINRDEIEQLDYLVDKNEHLSVGVIKIITEDGEIYPLLNIFGDDKRYIEDDAKIIAEGIAKLLND